jgi:hypothetical protein
MDICPLTLWKAAENGRAPFEQGGAYPSGSCHLLLSPCISKKYLACFCVSFMAYSASVEGEVSMIS